MSFSRLAAVGAVLAAGVTLASCASSASPVAASGPNPAAVGAPGGSARVHFIQGSPQLTLGVTNLDVYIDNKLAFPNFVYPFTGLTTAGVPVPAISGPVVVGPVSPTIALPIGTHNFRFLIHGTNAPAFAETNFTLKANTKYAIVTQGDAGFHTVSVGVFIEPIYATSNGAIAISYFNASPKAGSTDFWYNCPVGGLACKTRAASAVTVGSPAAATSSWKLNVILFPSTNNLYCFGAYNAGLATLIPGGGVNNPDPIGSDPQAAQCPIGVNAAPGTNANFYLIDLPSLPPLVAPGGPSGFVILPDQNG